MIGQQASQDRWSPGWITLAGLLWLGAWLCGCPAETEGHDQAPQLDNSHLGFKNQHCDICHGLPVEGHTVADPSACAACHGGNGACDPNGDQSDRAHDSGDDCLTCHGQQHQYDSNLACAGCHFATAGLDPTCGIDPPNDGGTDGGSDGGGDGGSDGGLDGDGAPGPDGGSDAGSDQDSGPELSNALVDNCFDWPATEFSPSNKTGVTTSLARNAPAVEFELDDLDGTSHRLSDLLRERPVLLVFGAFT
jgi:hypothetical protein